MRHGIVKVGVMSEPHIDPAGNTQQFRAFAQRHDQETAQQRERSYVVPIIVAVVLVAVAAAVAFTLLT